MSLIFNCFQNQIEPKEASFRKGETVAQLFNRMAEEQQLMEQIGYEISTNCLTIVQKNEPTKRIDLNEDVQSLLKRMDSKTLEVLYVFPTDEEGALIDFTVNKQLCYFQTYVNKNDKLESFVSQLLRKINLEKNYQITVNGKRDSLDGPIQKKTIKQIISIFNRTKIEVQICTKSQIRSVKEEHQSKSDQVQYFKKEQINKSNGDNSIIKPKKQPKKQEIVLKEGSISSINGRKGIDPVVNGIQKKKQDSEFIKEKQIPNNLQKEISQQLSINGSQQNLKKQQPKKLNKSLNSQIKAPQNSKKLIEKQKMEVNGNKNENSKNKQLRIQVKQQKEKAVILFNKSQSQKQRLNISFNTNFGQKNYSIEIQASKTMLEILPMILNEISSSGFDWDMKWKDYSEKLGIFYGKSQYKKLDRKISTFLTPNEQKIHEFNFIRHYEGG